MMNNNHHKTNCTFAGEIVSYIYDEIGAKEKSVFENHLADCSNCADEIAGLTNVSFSIGAWRDAEFAHLPTPHIEIPYENGWNNNKIGSIKSSWLAGIRQIFSLSPAWTTATAAMGALVLCAGLIFVAVNFSDTSSDLAEFDNKNAVKPVISPTTKNVFTQTAEDIAGNAPKPSNKSSVNPPNEPIQPELTKEPKNSEKSVNSAVKISGKLKNKSIPQNGSNQFSVKTNEPTGTKNNIRAVQNKKSPTLHNFEDEEDDSLRLADLFDEIETK